MSAHNLLLVYFSSLLLETHEFSASLGTSNSIQIIQQILLHVLSTVSFQFSFHNTSCLPPTRGVHFPTPIPLTLLFLIEHMRTARDNAVISSWKLNGF